MPRDLLRTSITYTDIEAATTRAAEIELPSGWSVDEFTYAQEFLGAGPQVTVNPSPRLGKPKTKKPTVTVEELLALPLGDCISYDLGDIEYDVLRVPGGWVYIADMSSTFVPEPVGVLKEPK